MWLSLKLIFWGICLLSLPACLTHKQASKLCDERVKLSLLAAKPQTISRVDTIIIREGAKIDTVFYTKNDTLVKIVDKVRVQFKLFRDTLKLRDSVWLQVECPPDTFVKSNLIQTYQLPSLDNSNGFANHIWLIIAILVMGILIWCAIKNVRGLDL